MKTLLFVLLSLIIFAGIITAQPPPPPAAAKGNAVVKPYQPPSLSNLSPAEKFSSADGRFTISLPKSISGFAAITPQISGKNITGSNYQWEVKEGVIVLTYIDYLNENFSVKTDEEFDRYFAPSADGMLTGLNAKILSFSKTTLAEYKGSKVNFETPDGTKGTRRKFLVGKRQYSLTSIFNKDVSEAEKLINQAFDTFTLISQKDSDEAIQRQIQQSTPPMLPQEPIAKKEKTDAEDENLKGRVKKLIEEDEDLSGTYNVQGRHPNSIDEYNEKRNRVKSLLYDSKGLPFEITVYGYIDGARVSSYKDIESDSNPPLVAPSIINNKKKPKIDPRYGYKYEYKYTDGKLVEEKLISNDGSLWMRYVYNYKDNQIEELVYSEDGKLNQKYLSVLDEKGNEIERTSFDVFGIRRNNGDEKSVIKYDSFDEKGNWTKKTTYNVVTENGKQISKPSLITYRTITYYQ